MKPKLRSAIRAIVAHYPYPKELTKTRLTKLLFLIDWKSVIKRDKPITQIEWCVDRYGPYSPEIQDEIDDDTQIIILPTTSNFGTIKYIVTSKGDKKELLYEDLDHTDIQIINTIINQTKEFTWNELIDYMYSKVPIKKIKSDYLDLLYMKQHLNDR